MIALANVFYRSIPGTFHGFFTATGLLFILMGFIYNKFESVLELMNKNSGSLVSGGDPVLLVGTFFISLGVIIYFIKVMLY